MEWLCQYLLRDEDDVSLPKARPRAIYCGELRPPQGQGNLEKLAKLWEQYKTSIIRLSRKVRTVVTMIGTLFLSARALASRSTPKVCSRGFVSDFTYPLRDLPTIYVIVVIVIYLYMGYKSPRAVVLQ